MTRDDPAVFDICGDLPRGTVMLEASAGTGKTWTISALVARFVAEGHARLDEMLIVTFGRAASQELRERVRTMLVHVEAALDGCLEGRPPSDPDDLLTLLTDVSPEEQRRRRDRLRDALTDFDAATIATTHQFCQLVLRGLGVAGDTDSGSRLVEELDDLLVEVVDDLYVRGFASATTEPEFDRGTALAVARAAVGDPQARLEPRAAPDGTVPARRRRFAEAVRSEMDLRKRRLGILSYDDLLSRLAAVLEDDNAPARERMRTRWRVVLVDEFQDTDPVQWQVLDRAFSGHATMVLIGDPKQAIYAFRGGDVTTYLQAKETAGTTATLGTSYRSDQPLLESLQTFLGGAALGDADIVVRPVRAAHTEPRLVGAPSPAPFRVRVVGRDRFGVDPAKGVPIGDLRQAVAEDLAADVAALLGSGATFCGRPLRAADVAVLCETRRQCEIARAGLAAAGIQAVIAGSGSVYVTEAADEWLCLLEAMEQPHRSARVRAAALTSFFGHTVADLESDGEQLTSTVAERLRDWALLLRDRGVAAVFETSTAAGQAPRVLGRVDGERLMTDLRHLAESLHDAATRDRLGLVALLGWMRARMDEARSDGTDERTRRLDSDAAAVQILTIHGSKGLQFPVVHLPFVSDQFPRKPAFPLFHDDEGHRCRDVGGPDSDPAHVQRAVVEESGEDLRLLYVAMTRAQSQLVTWWLPSAKNTEIAPLHRMAFGRGPEQAEVPLKAKLVDDEEARRTWGRWAEIGGPVVELLDDRVGAATSVPASTPDLEARTWTRSVDRTWRRTSYTALSAAAEARGAAAAGGGAEPVFGSEPEVVPRADEPDTAVPLGDAPAAVPEPVPDELAVPSPMAGLPVGATFGSLVHAVLEHADPAAPAHGGDLRAELLEHVHRQLVRWPVRLDPDELADALVAVCDSPLGPLAGERTLREIGVRDRMSELDFELPLAGGDLRGHPRAPGSLADLGPLLRRHLSDGDPLLPYADAVADPGHAAQVLHGYLTGSVDVVLRVDGRYVIVDYKTNWLGPRPSADDPEATLSAYHYRPEALDEAMLHSSYPLQALLYAVVLHRFLRWRQPGYDPAAHLGGVMYLYLRGMCGPGTPRVDGRPCGVFAWQPPVALVEELSDLLDGLEERSA